MAIESVKEKVDRLKLKADLFLKENIRAFVKDVYGTFYFCNIIKIEEDALFIKDFEGKREGITSKLFWLDIESIQEYKEKLE